MVYVNYVIWDMSEQHQVEEFGEPLPKFCIIEDEKEDFLEFDYDRESDHDWYLVYNYLEDAYGVYPYEFEIAYSRNCLSQN